MRAILGAVLAIGLASVAVSVEEAVELGAEVAVSAKVGYLMKPEDVDSLKIVDKYAEFNKKLQVEDHQIRTALETPPEDSKVGYTSVPGYKYSYRGRTIEDKSQAECELVCSTYRACQSYSYNSESRICIWSMSKITYDPDYTMWAKQLDQSGHHHTHEYMEMPGMRIQEKAGDIQGETSYEECKYQCSKDESCKTFSFDKHRMNCIKSGVPIHFDDKWTYNEKDFPNVKTKKLDHKKENEEKEALKKQWLAKSSTAAAREEIEITTKITRHLAHAQEEATNAEMVEKVARRASFYAQQKCVMMQGMAANSVKRNMGILNILGERQLEAVKKESASEKLNKEVKQMVTKESLMKAQMAAKIGVLKSDESKEKYHQLKPLEIDEKKNVDQMKERKEKACHKKIAKVDYFEKKEILMKSTEAAAKSWQLKRKIAASNQEYKKASAYAEVQGAKERSAKKIVEGQKEQMEAAEKMGSQTAAESGQKMAMDKVEMFKNKLKFSEEDEKAINQKNMVALEKRFKAKADKLDLGKVLKKKKEEWKKARAEQKQKSAAAAAAKESDAKRKEAAKQKEAADKKKETEVSKKKTEEEKVALQRSLEKMAADKAKEAADAMHAERAKNAVLDAVAKEKEKEDKRQKELAAATSKEKTEKQKTAEDELRSKNLLKQLRSSEVAAAQAAASQTAAAKSADDTKAKDKELQQKIDVAGPQEKVALQAQERSMKSSLVASSELSTKASDKKAETALSQAAAAKGLKAESCLMICREGKEVKDAAKKMENQQKVQEKMAMGGGAVELIQVDATTGADCEDFTPPAGGGDCGTPITASITQTICGGKSEECRAHCFNTATPIEANEASCKSSLPDEASKLVASTQSAKKQGGSMDEQERLLLKNREIETKESKAKIEAAKPVPFEIKEIKPEPFTYKGCEC